MIVAFDVLEHLTIAEIIAMLAAARRFLRFDPLVIARFPSGDSAVVAVATSKHEREKVCAHGLFSSRRF